jgi:hypothetical protein
VVVSAGRRVVASLNPATIACCATRATHGAASLHAATHAWRDAAANLLTCLHFPGCGTI